jgi:hypothetical protein
VKPLKPLQKRHWGLKTKYLLCCANIIAFFISLAIVAVGLPLVTAAKWLWERPGILAAILLVTLALLTFL